MPIPEEHTRENIDKQLKACGWEVQSRTEMNLHASREVAVREFPLEMGLVRAGRLRQAIPRSAFEGRI